MRLGCAAYSYRDYLKNGEMTLEQFVVECRKMGLDGVELTSYYFPSTDREYLNALKKHCFTQGMHILGTAIGSNYTQPEESRRREQVEITRQWIDHSVVLGAPCMRVFAGSIPAGHTEVDAIRWAVECLRECLPYAAEKGVVLALENHGGITATAQQVLRLQEEVRDPWFGINLDFGNFRNDPYHEFELCASHAVTTHAKRTMRGGDGRVPVDYARVADCLRRSGYAGYISVEYEDAEDPRTAVPAFVETLKQCFR